MIKSFMSKCNEAMMGELYGGEIFEGPLLPHSEYLKADEHIGESRAPKAHSPQLHSL